MEKPLHKEYYGKGIEKIPQLLSDKRMPLSVSDIIERRMNSVLPYWSINCFDTSDAFAYHPDGKVKLLLSSKEVLGINKDSEIKSGGLVLEDGEYERLDGEEFKLRDVRRFTGRELTFNLAKTSPFWKLFTRGRKILSDYIDLVFDNNAKYNFNKNLGIYLAPFEKFPVLRPVIIESLEVHSRLYSSFYLNNEHNRFVGVLNNTKLISKKDSLKQPNLEIQLSF